MGASATADAFFVRGERWRKTTLAGSTRTRRGRGTRGAEDQAHPLTYRMVR